MNDDTGINSSTVKAGLLLRITGAAGAVLLMLLFLLPVYGQNFKYRFENFGSENGFPDRIINAIVQDKQGFIWIGSDEGLTRYDGYSFVAYRHDDNDMFTISDNEVYAICPAKDGALWVGTRKGLNRYNPVNGHFEKFYHETDNGNSPAANEIFAIATDSIGNTWIGTLGGGLDKLTISKNNNGSQQYLFTHYRNNPEDPNSLAGNEVFAIACDRKNRIWAATSSGLSIIDEANKKIHSIYHDKNNPYSISNSVVSRIYINGNDVWLCGNGIFDRITASDNITSSSAEVKVTHLLRSFKLLTFSQPVINDCIKDHSGNTWIATNDRGLIKLYDGSTEQYINDPSYPYTLPSSAISCLMCDLSGVIWIGTAKGLSKYIPAKSAFEGISPLEKTAGRIGGFVMSILTDQQNRLWVATDSDTINVLSANGQNAVQHQKLILPEPGTTGQQVNTLFQSKAGDIYIGTLLSGIYIIPASLENITDTKKWKHINSAISPFLASNNIYSIAEDRRGKIWLGTYRGLCSYDAVSGKIQQVYVSPSRKLISDYIIRSIAVDDKNNTWCATDDGVSVLQEDKLLYQFKNDPSDTNSLSNNRVVSIFTDRNKKIWAGTKAGLNYYDPLINKFRRVRTADALLIDAVRSIVEDRDSNLWIATNQQLLKYSISQNRLYRYGIEDGLYFNQFVSNSVAIADDDKFYFGTNSGVLSFQPASILPNKFIPPVVITGIKIFDKPVQSLGDSVLLNTWQNENKLVLAYNQNFFSFEFAALNYINTAANQYKYQLEGVDKQWVNAGRQRIAGYTDIKPGHYTFKIKASNNDGLWNETPVTMEVIILSPWWQTWWFYGLCFLAASAIIYIIYRVRLKQILKLYRLRSSIAKDLHDDVGSALSSIAMLSRIAQEGKTNAQLKTEEIFSRIGNTSKRMIDLMDDIVWSVNPDNDRFSNMLIRMREYAVEMLEPTNIDFRFTIDEKIEELHIPMQMRKDYFLIFKEAVNNLAKYAHCSKASIVIEKANRHIITSVTDNGKGFDPEIINSGNGLKNMKERAASLNGKLEINTIAGKGTSIILTIPAG